MNDQIPLVNVGDYIKVVWENKDGSTEKLKGLVVNIEKVNKMKKGSFYKYQINFGTETDDIRETRLAHLNWKLKDTKKLKLNLPSTEEKRKRSRTMSSLPSHNYILAPMVGGSELAFRILCRKYGADLAYTPMMNSELFAHDPEYREKEFQTIPSDRPLVAHFSGNNPETMLSAALLVQDRCDAVDLNLGCPQRIAHTGHFGSYLLGNEDRDLILSIVRRLSSAISVPVFVKIRLLDSVEETLELVTQLIEAGAALVAIHARYRVNLVGRTGPGARDGPALLDQVSHIKSSLLSRGILTPIIANGNIRQWEDVPTNRDLTGADGVMSAEGLLDNPALFAPSMSSPVPVPPKLELALEYLSLVDTHPVKLRSVIFHTRRIAREELTRFQLLEDCVSAQSVSEVRSVVERAVRYRDQPESFLFDREKEAKAKEAAERRKREEGRRKEFESRMTRKAKREGKDPSHYLLLGAEVPTVEGLAELKRMPKEQAFEIWKAKHSQHCFNFHFEPNGCHRERTCSFLHADVAYSEQEHEAFG